MFKKCVELTVKENDSDNLNFSSEEFSHHKLTALVGIC